MKVKNYVSDYNNRNREKPKSGVKCLAKIRKLLDGYIKCFEVECTKYVFKECPDAFRVDLGCPKDYIDKFIEFHMFYGDKYYFQRQTTTNKKGHEETKDILCDYIPDFENRIIHVISNVSKDYDSYFLRLKESRLYTYSDKIRDVIDKGHFINTFGLLHTANVPMTFPEYYMKYAFKYVVEKNTDLGNLYKAIIKEYRYRKDIFKQMMFHNSNTDIISNIKDILYVNPKDRDIVDLLKHLNVSRRDILKNILVKCNNTQVYTPFKKIADTLDIILVPKIFKNVKNKQIIYNIIFPTQRYTKLFERLDPDEIVDIFKYSVRSNNYDLKNRIIANLGMILLQYYVTDGITFQQLFDTTLRNYKNREHKDPLDILNYFTFKFFKEYEDLLNIEPKVLGNTKSFYQAQETLKGIKRTQTTEPYSLSSAGDFLFEILINANDC